MKTSFRYTLEPYDGMKTRYRCPQCNQKGQFTRYVDCSTGDHIHETVGKCNREIKCGYHLSPSNYFEGSIIKPQPTRPLSNNAKAISRSTANKNSNIPLRLFNDSRNLRKPCNLFHYLQNRIGINQTREVMDRYKVGASNKKWPGATLFWQIDRQGQVKAGKIMLYDYYTGKRVKAPFPHITWIHKIESLENYSLNQCFFGEHLLNHTPSAPVGLVESEKTAIIASCFIKDVVWLATGSLNNINIDKCTILTGRDVIFYPDAGCYDLWKSKLLKVDPPINYKVSSVLENYCGTDQYNDGIDIADLLI